jgi:hypothetical protein
MEFGFTISKTVKLLQVSLEGKGFSFIFLSCHEASFSEFMMLIVSITGAYINWS